MNNPNISRLVLLKTSLENDYKHTIWFGDPKGDNTKTDQTNYFLSKKFGGFDFTNLTYIRKDNTIKIPAHYDKVVGANYVMYQNSSETKWYYAFITDIKYISEKVTELTIETDVIQTWMFAYTVLPSFVEREHVADDTIGNHTYPESIELGDFVVNHYEKDNELTKLKCVMASTVSLDGDPGNSKAVDSFGVTMNGMFSGLRYYVYNHLDFTEGTQKSTMTRAIEDRVNQTNAESVQSIFMAPEFLVKNVTSYAVNRSTEIEKYEKVVNKYYDETGLDSYSPANNKLYTYPFKFLRVNNGNGVDTVLKYEYFGHYGDNANDPTVATDCHFEVRGSLCPGCSIRMIPQWYKGIANNDGEGINAGKLPICNWSSDLFTNWMTQNGVNVVGSMINDVVGVASGVAIAGTGGGAMLGGATAVSSATSIASTIREVKNAQMQPPQTFGNINNGDVVTSSYNNTYHFYDMSVKEEYARIIDNYFNLFGYKVCRLKNIESGHRAKYWYTKTIDVNIDGGVPQKDLQIIKNAYNNGITFWRYEGNIGVYDNTPGYNKISKNYA